MYTTTCTVVLHVVLFDFQLQSKSIIIMYYCNAQLIYILLKCFIHLYSLESLGKFLISIYHHCKEVARKNHKVSV